LTAFLSEHDLETAAAGLDIPVLLLHAEGDERVPATVSQELARHLRSPDSRLIVVPGGHHRSIQHDAELQAVSLRFIERALGARSS
jgi:pimeloyl-ACP methyl ester carboxylesterase